MHAVTLPPGLEQFATEAVAAGRYRNVAEVVVSALDLLQHAEASSAALIASLDAAQDEGRRVGFVSVEEMERATGAIIEDAIRRQV
jgi:putative addiction module CopG family antidote